VAAAFPVAHLRRRHLGTPRGYSSPSIGPFSALRACFSLPFVREAGDEKLADGLQQVHSALRAPATGRSWCSTSVPMNRGPADMPEK
jgi:hypothetical protein